MSKVTDLSPEEVKEFQDVASESLRQAFWQAVDENIAFERERIRHELEERDDQSTLVFHAQPYIQGRDELNRRLAKTGDIIMTELMEKESWKVTYEVLEEIGQQRWYIDSPVDGAADFVPLEGGRPNSI